MLSPLLFSLFFHQVGIVLERDRRAWEKEGIVSLSGAMQEGESDPTLVMSKHQHGEGVSSANTAVVVVADKGFLVLHWETKGNKHQL